MFCVSFVKKIVWSLEKNALRKKNFGAKICGFENFCKFKKILKNLGDF
jgi:hypothetical protein